MCTKSDSLVLTSLKHTKTSLFGYNRLSIHLDKCVNILFAISLWISVDIWVVVANRFHQHCSRDMKCLRNKTIDDKNSYVEKNEW